MSPNTQLKIIVNTFLALLACLATVSCSGGGHPAVDVVNSYYEAFSTGDNSALMDTVAPDDRNKLGIGLFSLIDSLSLGLGSLGVDVGSLASVSYLNMEFELVTERDDYALVRAEGDIRNTAMGIEVPSCDMHDVRRADDGNWYIDIDAPERTQRLASIEAAQQEKLMELLNSPSDPSAGLFGDMAETMSIFTNMCE